MLLAQCGGVPLIRREKKRTARTHYFYVPAATLDAGILCSLNAPRSYVITLIRHARIIKVHSKRTKHKSYFSVCFYIYIYVYDIKPLDTIRFENQNTPLIIYQLLKYTHGRGSDLIFFFPCFVLPSRRSIVNIGLYGRTYKSVLFVRVHSHHGII